jgi:Peptidase family M20/M25/M40
MRFLCVALGGTLLILAAVLVGRTLLLPTTETNAFKSPEISGDWEASFLRQYRSRSEGGVPADEKALLERIRGFLRLETVSVRDPQSGFNWTPFDEFLARVKTTYPAIVAACDEILLPSPATTKKDPHEPNSNLANRTLLLRWAGTNAKLLPAMLMGHFDVVPVEPGTENQWTHPPFSADLDSEGFLWARGTIDDKMSVLTILEVCWSCWIPSSTEPLLPFLSLSLSVGLTFIVRLFLRCRPSTRSRSRVGR